jgi:hypothetical protein
MDKQNHSFTERHRSVDRQEHLDHVTVRQFDEGLARRAQVDEPGDDSAEAIFSLGPEGLQADPLGPDREHDWPGFVE